MALGTLALTGCGKTGASVKGVAPVAAADATVVGLAQVKAGKTVTLQGEMVDKCPVAGCWFHLRDKTGTVKVDTKASGFVVLDVPLHTVMTVTGTVHAGETPVVVAKGLRY